MKFADKIRNYRQQYQWTQQDVADRLLVSRKTISSWENSRSYPDIFMLVQISDLYHVSLDDLLREDHEMINSYKKEHIANKKADQIFRISYIVNVIVAVVVLLQLGTFTIGVNNNVVKALGTLLVIVTYTNALILLNYTNWQAISSKSLMPLTWFIITVLELSIRVAQHYTAVSNIHFFMGYLTGQLIGAVVIAFCLTCVIWLYPQFKERKDR